MKKTGRPKIKSINVNKKRNSGDRNMIRSNAKIRFKNYLLKFAFAKKDKLSGAGP